MFITLHDYILASKDNLVKEIYNLQLKLNPELVSFYTDVQKAIFKRDISYNLEYLATSIYFDSEQLFDFYIQWLDSVLFRYGQNRRILLEHIECIQTNFEDKISADEFLIIKRFLQIAINYFNNRTISLPLSELKEKSTTELFFNSLLNMDFYNAIEIIKLEQSRGLNIENIITNIYIPTLRETGLQWQLGKINVAQEHYISNAINEIVNQLHNQSDEQEIKQPTKDVLLACVGFEQHSLGIILLKKLYEYRNWNAHLIGAITPTKDLIDLIALLKPDLVAISVSLILNLVETKNAIEKIKSLPSAPKILLGGFALNIDQSLWKKLGGDGYAGDFQLALEISEKLINK